MSLREILNLTKYPIGETKAFAAQTIKVLVNIILQLGTICEKQEIELSKQVHCLDLKSNEWHIALFQIYENLFNKDIQDKDEKGQIKFNDDGTLIPEKPNKRKDD